MTHSEFKQLRESAEISQGAISVGAGIERARLSNWENGYVQLRPAEIELLEKVLFDLIDEQRKRLTSLLSRHRSQVAAAV